MSLISFLNKVVLNFQDKNSKLVIFKYDKQFTVRFYKGEGFKTISFEITPDQSPNKFGCRDKEFCCYTDLSIWQRKAAISNVGCKKLKAVDMLMNCALYTFVSLNLNKPLLITDSAEKDGKNILLYNTKNIIDGKRDPNLGFHYYEKWGFVFSHELQNLLIDAIKSKKSDKYILVNFIDQTGYWLPFSKNKMIKVIKTYKKFESQK